jgi:hypothetical protein
MIVDGRGGAGVVPKVSSSSSSGESDESRSQVRAR